jgi:RNA polymerase sigma-70 factor (ECF subfamily)
MSYDKHHPAPPAGPRDARADVDPIAAAYGDHQPELVRHLTRMLHDEEAAADLVQLSFERLVVASRAGAMPDNVRAWLYRVATNAAISDRRRARTFAVASARLAGPGTDDDPETIVVRSESSADVRALMADLPSDQQRALLMAAHGFSGTQIAGALGRTGTSTRTLICRGRSRLREQAAALVAA